MENAVIDTSVLVGFSGIRRLDIVRAVFPAVAVVPAVYDEIVTCGTGWEEARAAQLAIKEARFFIPVPSLASAPLPPSRIGRGEKEVIAYALARGIPALIDDSDARKAAKRAGVEEVIGTLGILGKAKTMGVLREVRDLVYELRRIGIRFDDALVAKFLKSMNEC